MVNNSDNQNIAFHSLMTEYYFDKWLYLIGLPIHWDDNLLDEALDHQKRCEEHRNILWGMKDHPKGWYS